jgi:lipid-A-disaccharide synthase
VRRKPGVAVLVDYPGFNLRFARLARGIVPRIFYYIGPQVWAWGGWRARTIPSLFDALLSIIPFECKYYRGTKLKCLFVGHPVLDLVNPAATREDFRAECGADNGLLVGLAPGSRREEVKRILPIMLESAKILKGKLSGVSFAVGVAETIETGLVRSMCERLFEEVSIVRARTHELMQASDLILVASGTATLEAAILGAPMLIIYKMSPLTWLLARGLVKVKHVGLANIIAGERIVPEFIQYDANPERISKEVLSLLGEGARLEEMRAQLAGVRRELGSPGASRRAAELVLELSGWK